MRQPAPASRDRTPLAANRAVAGPTSRRTGSDDEPGKQNAPAEERACKILWCSQCSLPLLVVSLIQLNNYRRDLDEQASAIARIETTAAAGSLFSWLEDHPAYLAHADSVPLAEAEALYARLQRDTASDPQTAIAVFDAQGRALKTASAQTPFPRRLNLPAHAERAEWSDSAIRMTGMKRVEQFGWAVAVGVPVAENTVAGRSIFMLAATWALALLASILLGVWAVGRFTKPLRKLASTASTLGEGQLQERVL